MQDLSYRFRNVTFKAGSFPLEIMIYTFSNAYSLDPENTQIQEEDGVITLACSRLLTCGGQVPARGDAEVTVRLLGNRIAVSAAAHVAKSTEEIRCLKLSVKGLKSGEIMNLVDHRPRKIGPEGIRFSYPHGWRDAAAPLVILSQPEGGFLYFRSLDRFVRRKTFVFNPQDDGLCAELIFEEDARDMGNRIAVPDWEIGYTERADEMTELMESQRIKVAEDYGLLPWEERPDVPDWARKISLVAAIHGQHWTGYIFNDYAAMLENIKRLCDRIEPERILAYLPGWEGRYYWQYGDYGPDERMGGEKGFRTLCEEAGKLGVHLMPMFGINIVSTHHEGFATWGETSEPRTASGNFGRGSVDWDGSRHYDHGSLRSLNPAAPKWQNRLVRQITCLAEEYGFHAVFLDIAAGWHNDPNHKVYPGVFRMARRLRQNDPQMLLAGEGWYDALGSCIPLLQCGHTNGKMHWHDESYGAMFDTYTREFAHLCLGDPSRLSTGVHELGTNPEWRAPLRKGVIPTLTVVDGTLENAPERVELIIEDAKEYARRYL